MRDIGKLLVGPFASITDVVKVIDEGRVGIALVVDEDKRLMGVVTDVDIRKALVRGLSLSDPVRGIMASTPEVAHVSDTREAILERLNTTGLRQVPVLDDGGVVVGVEIIKDLYGPDTAKNNRVVIMAGGAGSRLMPMTREIPKPLLPIGKRPILGTILEALRRDGYDKIFVMTHHFSEKIEEYLKELDLDSRVTVVREDQPMGTGGALSSLPRKELSEPFIVMNADLLTNVSYSHLLDFHAHVGAVATMCVKEYDIQMDYGAVEMDGHHLKRIVEKPKYSCHVNAGIYVLEPRALDYVPKQRMDMTDLFDVMMAAGERIACFPIREFWMDIGKKEDYEKAQQEFRNNF